MRASRGSSFWLWLAGIVALGVAIRVGYTIAIAPWPPRALTDEYYYSYLPSLIATGQGIIDPLRLLTGVHAQTALHAPLYPFVLTGLYELAGTGQEAQRLLGSMFGAVTIVTLALIGRRIGSARTGLIAAGLAALYPMLITADGALMAESLYGMLVALALLAALRWRARPGWRPALALGAITGLAALTRGEGFLLLLLLIVPMLRSGTGRRSALVAVAALLVVVSPWTIRNAVVFHRFVLVSNDLGITIAGANCPVTYQSGGIGAWFPGAPCTRPRTGGEAAVSAAYLSDGLHYAEHHLSQLPLVLVAREGRVWSLYQPGLPDDGRDQTVEKLGIACFYGLALLAAAGLLILRRRGAGTWVLIAPIVMTVIVAAVTFGLTRFREPAELSVLVLAAITLDALATAFSARRTRRAGPDPAST